MRVRNKTISLVAREFDMKRIHHHTSLFQSETDYVLRALDSWKPSSFALLEKQQEQALQAWLRKCLPDVPVLAQYGIAKGKADLVIQDSHVIELKLGFGESSVAEFDRCVGQMERYRQKWVKADRGSVYLVVVGDSDPEFRALLHNWFEETNSAFLSTILSSPPFHLIEKRTAVTPGSIT